MKKIYCAGGGVADIIVHPFDRLPKPGTSMKVDPILLKTGGCALNAAVALRRLGADPMLTCKLGSDYFGDFVVNSLADNGVDTSRIARKAPDGSGTHVSLVCVNSEGERSFVGAGMEAEDDFRYEDIDFEAVDLCDILFIAGYLGLSTFDGEPAAKVLRYAKEHGKITALDTITSRMPDEKWMPLVAPCLPYLDYFMPSIGEAVRLVGGETDPLRIALLLKERGAKNIVLKLGEEGSFYYKEDGTYGTIPCYQVNAIDTNGAGDSFCAGFLMGVALGYEIADCCKLANAVGAQCVTSVGAATGIGTLAQTRAFIEAHGDSLAQ